MLPCITTLEIHEPESPVFDCMRSLMTEQSLSNIRSNMRAVCLKPENDAVTALVAAAALDVDARAQIVRHGAALVASVRSDTRPSLMEAFLAEYGLSTKEGLALMCLAEALLRVPDATTIDALIEDKILDGKWGQHAGNSISQLVNVSTMGLQVTSAVLREGQQKVTATLQAMVKRLGMPVIRKAVQQVMKELGRQFVLGQDIDAALKEARKLEAKGFTYSYDMLGEAALTAADAASYFRAYSTAVDTIAAGCSGDVRENPGISIKLSALHPRYEQVNADRVVAELVPRVLLLAKQAKAAGMGLNIDAEEADRLDLSLSVIEAVLSSPDLAGWDGFGVVVQAYGKRAPYVLDWLYDVATKLDRRIMVRLVKGAYWDTEIKRAQVLGLEGYPVFTSKAHSDVSYIACAKKLFDMLDRIYPQFATHNAHTVAAVMHYASNAPVEAFEFQRLHGMGESLHDVLRTAHGNRCRIYAPVGVHRDLLAYLVRRLLENGANSSFVNQIVDTAIAPERVASDPFARICDSGHSAIALPAAIFGAGRVNARGWDVTDPLDLATINESRQQFKNVRWHAAPITARSIPHGEARELHNPANPDDLVGDVVEASADAVDMLFEDAGTAHKGWQALGAHARAALLEKAADAYEENAGELFALLAREAGKSLPDAISELREAVDFLRFYAIEARRRVDGKHSAGSSARGVFVCISPWNFPLAIFTGQIAAALVSGNAVIAKPAEATPLVAAAAVRLLHVAGVPPAVLQFVPGAGHSVGAALTGHHMVGGVCFTGSTITAQRINRTLAEHCRPEVPLVAETGGLNAMIVDSTALPEQAVKDIIASAFQSAGQRCSALRMLYVQEDVSDTFLEMLFGAIDELKPGQPWFTDTDVGPVIDDAARTQILDYCADLTARGQLLKKLPVPGAGHFVAPCVFSVSGIEVLEREIFGPVLHVATFKASEMGAVVTAINAKGYGLTLGMHSRIDERVEMVKATAHVGNIYINRNQIGAVVGSQPFGGEGLSGTGPKAGGPDYLDVFMAADVTDDSVPYEVSAIRGKSALQRAVKQLHRLEATTSEQSRQQLFADTEALFPDLAGFIADIKRRLEADVHDCVEMPGPVGEANVLTRYARGLIVCLGSSRMALVGQFLQAVYTGNRVLLCSPCAAGFEPLAAQYPLRFIPHAIDPQLIAQLDGVAAVALHGDAHMQQQFRRLMAASNGALIPLVTDIYAPYRYSLERHCCTDTTAAGGDAKLLAGQG